MLIGCYPKAYRCCRCHNAIEENATEVILRKTALFDGRVVPVGSDEKVKGGDSTLRAFGER